MNDNSATNIRIGPKEFKKIANPHLKKKENLKTHEEKKEVEEKDKKNETEMVKRQKQMQKQNQGQEQAVSINSIVTKESLAESLLKEGYIESFVDYFYIASRKTPDIKSKYEKEHNIIIESLHNKHRELSHQYELSYLKKTKEFLVDAEDAMRSGNIIKTITYFKDLVKYLQYTRDILGPIYFAQKSINLAKRYNLLKQLIDALIEMGYRFDNTFVKEDLMLSMSFKEEAKKLYKHLNQEDYDLEKKIFISLIQLYKELSNQAENQNNFDKAIEYLNKQMENLKNLTEIIPHINEKDKEKEYLEQQIEVYLKIANLNFKMKYYDATLDCLEILKPLIFANQESNVYLVKGLYLYAQTYEALEQYTKAIDYLAMIEKNDVSMQTTEENIFAKSLLNLGRLHFKQNNWDLSFKNLKSFFKKAKSTDNKELLDIGRVNLGMIRGTQEKNEYIQKIKTTNYNDFLKMKLKYFSDAN